VKVEALKVKYPQGAEKQLIKALLNREVPRGGLPFDVGVIVQNVGTAKAVYDAVAFNKPLIERVITVSGNGINEPKNILVRLGTPVSSVLKFCGGAKTDIHKVIMGGPMMGISQFDLEVPVIKGSSGVLVMQENKDEEAGSCIRCGRCVDVCPMRLTPNQIADYVQKEKFDVCKSIGVQDCMECGACGFVCSAKLPLVHYFKYAKLRLLAKK
jgi:Na+-translocating ferredoxin:NAD+ oxidoreductase subunit C